MTSILQAAPRRNAHDDPVRGRLHHSDHHPERSQLSPGAREILRRTRWSEARCIAVAEAWGFGISVEL